MANNTRKKDSIKRDNVLLKRGILSNQLTGKIGGININKKGVISIKK